eukprot:scaffold300508_cov20-Prasinocladus_malaysianus.AAC.1
MGQLYCRQSRYGAMKYPYSYHLRALYYNSLYYSYSRQVPYGFTRTSERVFSMVGTVQVALVGGRWSVGGAGGPWSVLIWTD